MNAKPKTALIWTPDLSVHMENLDSQHRSILRLIDTWWRKLNAGEFNPTKKNLSNIFSFLSRFTQQHLELEERILDILADQFGYSVETTEQHKLRHHVFRSEIMPRLRHDIMLRVQSGDSGSDLLRPIAKWWVTHIKTNDRDYGDVLAGLSHEDRDALHIRLVDSLLDKPIVTVSYKQFAKAIEETA
ncbi:hemerythrin domain-containing protein [Pseudodesulfovibrio thermohalotolerans]|uniref:bacteriohemerythrin n=1 Tax=Pseudodesulfovibrio thermohalotolerans TaxID=2880651 RepID=UPI0022B9EF10|nr:hemerythrin domain-containing protein [Pseudodesulfovibrio thermohalotolerans]WFS62566.1 hemerythrin domain-containing protein [Pseudodesulfovibrio thermohalotolerans]